MVWFAITKSKLDGLHSTTTNQRILSEDWIWEFINLILKMNKIWAQKKDKYILMMKI
jgi:hypothetical protein